MGRSSLVIHGPVLTDGRELPAARIETANGRIVAVRPGGGADGADLVVADGWIIPGLIDLQVNGAGGVDLTSAHDPDEAVAAVAGVLAQHGVTAFCPTVVSSPPEAIPSRLVAYGARAHPGGAESLGAHLEGPFLDPEHRGVHDPAALRLPDAGEIERWLATRHPTIVTLAPELPGALAAIRRLAEAGVVVSLGHSGADAAAARAGLEAGARMGTHLFNAMPPFHHRQPGLVGALLAGSATLGIIADGVHVDPLAIDVAVRAAGPGRIALVSDALAAAATPPSPSRLGAQTVLSDGRIARRADGTMAGSAILLDGGLRNVRSWLPWLPPAEVVRMATRTPAEALGGDVAARKGRVAPGYDADLVILDPDWQVVATVVRGVVLDTSSSKVPSTR
ncbi:MAG: N-acetylglucosamine-6-phosphate deacetylase [Chloroflexi bacterium]|nr:N-acetylglucosamine-6-phosphate deacetylase [Chloroflexota bacterium]